MQKGKSVMMNKTYKMAVTICLFSFGLEAVFLGGQNKSFLTEQKVAPLSYLERSVQEREVVMSAEEYENIAISRVSDYVNVRQEPTTSSTIVGKIYNNCAADILETVDGEDGQWYRIRSGTVSGYIKAQYFITGAQAEAVAKEVGIQYATINTAALRLRAEPNLTSETLTMLVQGAEYVVLEEKDHFARLSVDEDLEGYVSMDYIKTRVEFKQAVSLEEEAAKQAEEARRRQEAQEAIQRLEEVKLVEAKNDQAAGQAAHTGAPGGDSIHYADGSGTVPTSAPSSSHAQETDMMTIAANLQEREGSAQGPASSPETAAVQTVAPGDEAGPGGTAAQGRDLESLVAVGESSSDIAGNVSSAVITATRTAIVAYARQFLGNPYVYGGTSLTDGADCSGFVMRIYEHFGISTGRNSREQAGKGREIGIDAVQPGDLLFYASGSYINHVAIYIGGGQVIHAASAKTGIIISPANYRTPCKAVTFLD